MLKKVRDIFKVCVKWPFITSAIALAAYFLPMRNGDDAGFDSILGVNLILLLRSSAVLVFSALFLLYARGRISVARESLSDKEPKCVYFYCLVGFFALMALAVAAFAMAQPLGFPQILKLVIRIFSLAMFEEIVCRGVFFEDSLRAFGNGAEGVRKSFYLSSAVFGVLHVMDWNTLANITSWPVLMLAVLKTIQTFILGCFFCAQMLRRKSLLWSSLLHFLFNIFPILLSLLSGHGEALENGYAVLPDTVSGAVSYVIFILIELPLFFGSRKILKARELECHAADSAGDLIGANDICSNRQRSNGISYKEFANNMDTKSFYKLSYGVFVLSVKYENKSNACISNTFVQVAADPARIAISCINANYTTELIKQSGKFIVSVLDRTCTFDLIRHFGMQSGRNVRKFDGFEHKVSDSGVPYVDSHCCAVFECDVISGINLGSHTLFIAEVKNAQVLSANPPLTYADYQSDVKPKAEKPATAKRIKAWRCRICGYVYEGEKLPADYTCPLCGHPADDFEPVYE